MKKYEFFVCVEDALRSSAQYVKIYFGNDIPKEVLKLSVKKSVHLDCIDKATDYAYDIDPDDEKFHYTKSFQLLAKLKNLHILNFRSGYVLTKIPTALGEITSLKELEFEAYTKDFQALKPLKNLEYLDLKSSQTSIKTLVELLIDKPLQTLKLKAMVTAIPPTMQKLEHLRRLELHKVERKNHGKIINQLCKLIQLKDLYYACDGNTLELPEEILGLKFINRFLLNFPSGTKSLKLPEAFLKETQVFINTEQPTIKKHYEFLENYASLEQPLKDLIHAIVTNQRHWLETLVENPFKAEDYDPTQSVFFIAGRTNKMGFVKKEIKEKLTSYGSKVASSPNAKVTHLLLGSGITEKVIDKIIQNPTLKLVLDDHFREYTIDQEDTFLMEEDNTDLNLKVLELLLSPDETNIQIGLSMLEAGGASKQSMTVVMILMLVNDDNEVRKSARKIFRKYASLELKEHIEKHQALLEEEWTRQSIIYNHPELDSYSYIITRAYFSNQYILNLDDYPFDKIPDMISLLTNVKDIYFNNNKDIDIEAFLSQLAKLPNLEALHLKGCNISSLPKNLSLLKNLDTVNFSENSITSIEAISQLPQIKSLFVTKNPIKSLPSELSLLILSAEECAIESIPADANWENCISLYLSKNKIKNFPKDGFFKALTHLDLSENLISELALNKKNAPKIIHLNVGNNKIKKASIKELPVLESLDLSQNKISNLELKDLPLLEFLTLTQNKLKEIDLLSLDNLRKVFLQNNLLSKLKIDSPNLEELKASDNQLTKIPRLPKNHEVELLSVFNNPITDLSPLKDLDLINAKVSFDPIPNIDPHVFKTFKTPNFIIFKDRGQDMSTYPCMPIWYVLHFHRKFYVDNIITDPPRLNKFWHLMRKKEFDKAKNLANGEGWGLEIFDLYHPLLR